MKENQIFEDCQLEWHRSRGVLYIHRTGRTVLRISGLDSKNQGDLKDGMIDIHIGEMRSLESLHPKGSAVSYPDE